MGRKAADGRVRIMDDQTKKRIREKVQGPDVPNGRAPTREQVIAQLQKFTMFSDIFMSVALEDLEACQYVLRILTGNRRLKLRAVKSQYRISQLTSHDAQLDVLAEAEDGALYALEVQQWDTVNHPRRVRFYNAVIDSSFLQKGCGYEKMPEVQLFYIEAKDFQKSQVTVWEVEKCQGKTQERYEDGLHTTYVNAEVDDQSEIARLMKYFKTTDPEDMSAGALSRRVHFLKKTEGGWEKMCEVTDWFWQKGYESGEHAGYANGKKAGERRGERRGMREKEKELVSAWAENGYSVEKIAKLLGKTEEYVRRISGSSLRA